MCGICGVVEYGWPGGVSAELIGRMRDAMAHRGPDDAGEWISPDSRVGLGHRRLSIVDLSHAGHQPMWNEDGSVAIVYNGEVYNHAELRSELERAGHVYRSRTDTETLVHLWEEHGPAMLERLRGMFAFAIWDARERRLFAARDRIGIKPLYYAQQDGRLIFASEIKALLEHPALSPELDEAQLYHYLTFMTTPAPSTLFRGISKLPAGHWLELGPDGRLEVGRWWDPAAAPALPASLSSRDACAERVLELLESSVEERLMADVPYGVFLSGGVDSSAITALVRRLHGGPLRTFSVGFEDAPELDERGRARRVAELFETEHHEVVLRPEDVMRYIPRLIEAQDEPLADWVCVPLHYVSRLLRDSGTVVGLVGEGSDEQFAGYRHYHRYFGLARSAWPAYNRLPISTRKAVHRLVDPLLSGRNVPREVRDLVRRAAAGESLFVSGAVAAWEADKRDLASGRLKQGVWSTLSSEAVAEAAAHDFRARNPGAHFVDTMVYQELRLRLPELLLMRVDKVTMSNSVEARVPFLDHRLVELTMRLPVAWRTGGGRTKDLLKRAVASLLPADVIDRPKQGFALPVKAWLRGPLHGWASASILDSRLRELDLFDYDRVQSLLREHRSGRRNNDTLIWALLNVSRWYDRWVAAEPERELATV